jgi:hypothetical protein
VGAHGIDTALQRMAEDTLVEKHQRIHRLVLGRSSDVAVHGQIRQERFNLRLGGVEVLTRPHAVKPDEADDPLHIGTLGMNGIVLEAEHVTDFIKQFWLLTSCRG